MSEQRNRAEIAVTVLYCAPGVEDITEVRVPAAATVREAVAAARLLERWPQLHDALDVGIWSRRCSLDQQLCDGDRVEIYRPLTIDPKEARRRRAQLTQSPGKGRRKLAKN